MDTDVGSVAACWMGPVDLGVHVIIYSLFALLMSHWLAGFVLFCLLIRDSFFIMPMMAQISQRSIDPTSAHPTHRRPVPPHSPSYPSERQDPSGNKGQTDL